MSSPAAEGSNVPTGAQFRGAVGTVRATRPQAGEVHEVHVCETIPFPDGLPGFGTDGCAARAPLRLCAHKEGVFAQRRRGRREGRLPIGGAEGRRQVMIRTKQERSYK